MLWTVTCQTLMICLCRVTCTESTSVHKIAERKRTFIHRYGSPKQGGLRKRHTNEPEPSPLHTLLDTQALHSQRRSRPLSLAHISPIQESLCKCSLLALGQCRFFSSFTAETGLDCTLRISVTLRSQKS